MGTDDQKKLERDLQLLTELFHCETPGVKLENGRIVFPPENIAAIDKRHADPLNLNPEISRSVEESKTMRCERLQALGINTDGISFETKMEDISSAPHHLLVRLHISLPAKNIQPGQIYERVTSNHLNAQAVRLEDQIEACGQRVASSDVAAAEKARLAFQLVEETLQGISPQERVTFLKALELRMAVLGNDAAQPAR